MTDLTRNQQLVFDVLQTSTRQMSAYEILDKLRPQGLKAPLQIYRALEKLVECQLVHKLESLNAYVNCSHRDCQDHDCDMTAFTICQECGDVSEFRGDIVADILGQQTSKSGFKTSHAAIEIKGTCMACQ